MEQEKLYEFSELDYVHNNLNLCEQKEAVLKLLKTSKPKQVEKFKYDTDWDFHKEEMRFSQHYIQIENAEIQINTIFQDMSDLAKFILRVAYYSNSQLLFPIDDEGHYTAIITSPVDENKIRVSITNEFGWYIDKYSKILADFIIERKTFIEQFNNLFKEYLNGIREISCAYKDVSLISKNLNLYLDNPKEFHSKFKLENYVRVFDIAYKDLDENWKFVLYNSFDLKAEDEDKTTISYWQKLKDEKKILDFDFLEQDAIEEEYIEIIKTDYTTRVKEQNWAYSKYFDKFYSSNEPMDCHINSENILHKNLNFKIDVNLDDTSKIKNSIIKECNLAECYEFLDCDLIITDESSNSVYKILFRYKNFDKIENNIRNLKEKKYTRIYTDSDIDERRLHLWYDNDDNVKLSFIKEQSFTFYDYYYEQEEILNLAIDGKTFINGVLNAFKEFKNDLKTYK